MIADTPTIPVLLRNVIRYLKNDEEFEDSFLHFLICGNSFFAVVFTTRNPLGGFPLLNKSGPAMRATSITNTTARSYSTRINHRKISLNAQ